MTGKNDIERVATTSPDMREELLNRLREVVPEAFADGEVDLERLRALIKPADASGPERYGLDWAGKREAIAMLQAPSGATLVPDRAESVRFDEARHVFVEGDNLEVLKLIRHAYAGRVKLIYIDPPYNTGNDFIYPDDFADPLGRYLKLTGQATEEGDLLTSKPEVNGRKHSRWLSMIYPRLALARQFLREDGFIVISIDDAEVMNLRRLMDELYGEENFVAVLIYDRNRKNDAKLFSVGHEYMLVFARNKEVLKELNTELRALKDGVEELRAEFERLRSEFDDDWVQVRIGILAYYGSFGEDDPRLPLARYRQVDALGPFRTDGDISWPGGGGPRYDVLHPSTGRPCKVPKRGWVYPTRDRFMEMVAQGRVIFGPDETTIPSLRRNIFDRDQQVMRSVMFSYAQIASQQFDAIFDDTKIFENPKSFTDLERLVSYLSGPDDLVMDFFAGSNTAMHGVVRANANGNGRRGMIAIQMPQAIEAGEEASNNALAMGFRTIADIARERIRRVLAAGVPKYDNGFRAFRLAPSNLRRWAGVEERTGEAYVEQLEAFADGMTPGAEVEDVIWEVALREGYPLTAAVEQIGPEDGPAFHRVVDETSGRAFTICLDQTLTLSDVKALKLDRKDLLVVRDTALDDTLAANLALQCTLKVL